MFLASSLEVPQVPKLFPKAFPIAPQFYHMVCPKFNPHVYKLKSLAIGEYICLNFAIESPKRCFHWGSDQCSKVFVDGPMNMALSKKKHTQKRSYEHNHELINMNHTRLEGVYDMNYYSLLSSPNHNIVGYTPRYKLKKSSAFIKQESLFAYCSSRKIVS